tara:strand:- start:220 stop:1203 length:984 start_codon:yes stop_codon:yes gene_type:complete
MATLQTTNLKEEIKKARPNIKDSTIKMYESNLKKLQKMFNTKDWDFLKDVEEVKDKIKHLHYTSQRNYYNSIIILLMALNSEKKEDKLLSKYNTMRDNLNKKYEDENATGKISDKQKINFVDIQVVKDGIEAMGKELKEKKFKKADNLSAKDKTLLMVYTLFQIHIRLPLRNDLAQAQAINKREFLKLSEEDKKANNYLIVEKSKMFLAINKFKTSKKFEALNINIPKDLEKLLRTYIRINGMGILFKSSTGTPLTRNALSQMLIKFSKKYMDGKSISTTMLRKIVLSDKFGDLKKEQKEMSKITGHSVETMNNVYVKEGQGKEDKS